MRHDIGRLLVIDRGNHERLVGYLGRTGIAAGWRHMFEEEQVRESGWLSRFTEQRLGRVAEVD